MDGIIIKIVNRVYSCFLRMKMKECGKKVVFHFHARTLTGLKYVSVGTGTAFGKGVIITAWDSYRGRTYSPSIEIGMNCHFGDNNHITSCNGIRIGDNLLTGRNVTITDNSHGSFQSSQLDVSPSERCLVSKGKVTVGKNVWLGSNVCIMPGVSIGDGVVVAANSVVTKDVPSKTMVGGVPARVLKSV